ncbi:DUF4190 domain-containing protein [Hamadaea tsunoensis]|uniref:DUF4190 domain-containing protein n=1 Tax=Hamadaea tsunoensis TaxID=53368 RepID=UPI0004057A16|nr:DUF4190 domain-containing protein [Hamadaea tsunoensis]
MTYPPPPGNPDPYGQQPAHDPYSAPQPPAADPYGAPQPPAAPQNPYDPYAQQQPPAPQYGQQPVSPYGATPQYPAYGAPMADPNKNNGLAIGSMATGIGSILLACCCGVLGLLAGVVAVVLGIIANKQISERGGQGKGMALAGIITGGVGILIALALIIWALSGGQQSLINDIVNSSNS